MPEILRTGLILTAGQKSVVSIWREKASGPLHLIHLGYGAGSFLVPQIVKPFLSKRTAETSSQFFLHNCNNIGNVSSAQNDTQLPDDGQEGENNFENGYIIVMAIILSVASIYYAFFCCSRRQIQKSPNDQIEAIKTAKEIFNFSSCSPGHPYYAAMILAFLVIWFYISAGGQMIFANYLYSYCRDMLCLDKDQAADIQSMFWIGFTAGRFAGFVVAMWAPMKILIFIEAGGNLISALVLFFNPRDVMIVKGFSLISGFFVGPLYPSGVAWANRYITMTGLAYTITLIGASLAGVSFTVAIGWYFEHKGPGAIWYFVIGYSCVACVTAIMMHLVARTRGDKYEREEDRDEGNGGPEGCKEETNYTGELQTADI